jgi:hypothetical protein
MAVLLRMGLTLNGDGRMLVLVGHGDRLTRCVALPRTLDSAAVTSNHRQHSQPVA